METRKIWNLCPIKKGQSALSPWSLLLSSKCSSICWILSLSQHWNLDILALNGCLIYPLQLSCKSDAITITSVLTGKDNGVQIGSVTCPSSHSCEWQSLDLSYDSRCKACALNHSNSIPPPPAVLISAASYNLPKAQHFWLEKKKKEKKTNHNSVNYLNIQPSFPSCGNKWRWLKLWQERLSIQSKGNSHHCLHLTKGRQKSEKVSGISDCRLANSRWASFLSDGLGVHIWLSLVGLKLKVGAEIKQVVLILIKSWGQLLIVWLPRLFATDSSIGLVTV